MCAAVVCALEKRRLDVSEVRRGATYFSIRDETRTVSFPHKTGECCVCRDDSGLKMQCGHFICPDDILNHAWEQIKHLKFEICCASCPAIIKIDDIIKFGLPDWEEKQFIEAAISVNFCESQDIQQCPSCQSYCQRKRTDNPQVQCSICTKKQKKDYVFCWYCLREWNNPGNYQICGNQDCKRVEIEQLRKSPKKDFKDMKNKVVSVPAFRACPNCFTVIEHKDGCNEMTCIRCKRAFCFICLSKTKDGSLVCTGRTFNAITCIPAPIQTKLRN